MAAKDITHLLFLDIENTAKHPINDRPHRNAIVEIACASLRLSDYEIVDRFETLIRPQAGESQAIWDGHGWAWDLGDFHKNAGHFAGVDWQDFDRTMTLEQALSVLVSRFLPGATLAGQNPGFDVEHLQRDCAALGIPWPETDYHRIDLCSPAIFLFMGGEIPGVSLRHSREWAYHYAHDNQIRDFPELPAKQQHRAGPDVTDAIGVFLALADVFLVGLRAHR